MKRIVIDASALAEYLLRSPRGVELELLLVERGYDLHVPSLCDVELMAVLRRGLLSGRLSGERAVQVIDDLRDLPLTRHGHQKLLEQILVLRRNFSAYDAAYVALAERLDAALLTDDLRLGRAVSAHSNVHLMVT